MKDTEEYEFTISVKKFLTPLSDKKLVLLLTFEELLKSQSLRVPLSEPIKNKESEVG